MKTLTFIIKTTVIAGIALLFWGCGHNFDISGQSLDLTDKAVATAYVTTTPKKTKIALINLDIRTTAAMNSTVAPVIIHYLPLPDYGSYLSVSHPDFKTKIIRLSENKKKIHVVLEEKLEDKKKCESLKSFSMAFVRLENMPDIYHLSEETSYDDLLNEGLAQPIPWSECTGEEYVLGTYPVNPSIN